RGILAAISRIQEYLKLGPRLDFTVEIVEWWCRGSRLYALSGADFGLPNGLPRVPIETTGRRFDAQVRLNGLEAGPGNISFRLIVGARNRSSTAGLLTATHRSARTSARVRFSRRVRHRRDHPPDHHRRPGAQHGLGRWQGRRQPRLA